MGPGYDRERGNGLDVSSSPPFKIVKRKGRVEGLAGSTKKAVKGKLNSLVKSSSPESEVCCLRGEASCHYCSQRGDKKSDPSGHV